MKTYHIKKLIPGWKIKSDFKDIEMVAVREITEPFVVVYKNKQMTIRNWNDNLHILEFPDKFGRHQSYKLGYFNWKPDLNQLTLIDN
jgi:hypothetical protein